MSTKEIPLKALTAVWVAYLLLPLHLLQQFRVSMAGWTVPVYYFFAIPPVLCLALYALASKKKWSPVESLWWLWPVLLLGSIVLSPSAAWSLREGASWMLRGFAVGGMYLLWAQSPFPRAARWAYAAAVLAALWGLGEIWFGRNPLVDPLAAPSVASIPEGSNPFYSPYRPGARLPMTSARPLGTQGNRIPYAASLLPFLSLALTFSFQGRRQGLHRLAALILLSLILLAGSLSVLAGLAVLLIVYGLTLGMDKKILAAGLAFTAAAGAASWRQGFLSKYTSLEHRLESWRTVAALKGHWFFGVGYGQYPNVYLAHYRGPLDHLPTPDNQYLRWFIETGVWGLAALAGLLAWLICAGRRRLKESADAEQARIYNALLAGWAAIATTFVFFDGFYWGACNMTFWSFLGLWAVCLKRPQMNRNGTNLTSR